MLDKHSELDFPSLYFCVKASAQTHREEKSPEYCHTMLRAGVWIPAGGRPVFSLTLTPPVNDKEEIPHADSYSKNVITGRRIKALSFDPHVWGFKWT